MSLLGPAAEWDKRVPFFVPENAREPSIADLSAYGKEGGLACPSHLFRWKTEGGLPRGAPCCLQHNTPPAEQDAWLIRGASHWHLLPPRSNPTPPPGCGPSGCL